MTISRSRLANEDVFNIIAYLNLGTAISCALVSRQFSFQALTFLKPLKKSILSDFIGKQSELVFEGKHILQHWHAQTSKMYRDCRERDRLMKYWQDRWATGQMNEHQAEEAWERQEEDMPYDMDDEAVRLEQAGEDWIRKASRHLYHLDETCKRLHKKHNFSESTKAELDILVANHNDFYNQLSSLQAMLQQ